VGHPHAAKRVLQGGQTATRQPRSSEGLAVVESIVAAEAKIARQPQAA